MRHPRFRDPVHTDRREFVGQVLASRWEANRLGANGATGDHMSSNLRSFVVLVAVMSAACGPTPTPQSTPKVADTSNVLPKPEQLFTDAKIGRTYEESKPG